MKNLLIAGVASMLLFSCKKDATLSQPADAVSLEVQAKISALGFNGSKAVVHEEGFLVEGDIVITPEMMNSSQDQKLLRIAEVEQYRTTNIVSVPGTTRNITIRVDSKMPSKYVGLTDQMIARYNAEGLKLTFSRVSSGGNIVIKSASRSAQYLASAGFPTSSGAPYGSVLVNTFYLDRYGWNNSSIISILAHEVGHCIGFRHTDYMSRQYSCGGSAYNEGASTVGAVHIPGTPTGPDPNSWMLACIGKDVNRNFNANDKTALAYLY